MSLLIFAYRKQNIIARKNELNYKLMKRKQELMDLQHYASEYNTAAPMALNHAADVVMHITTSQARDNKIFAKANTAAGIAPTITFAQSENVALR